MLTAPAHPLAPIGKPRARTGLLLLALGLSACGDERGPYRIEVSRERARAERPVPPGATTRDRLGRPPEPVAAVLRWDRPKGWESLPASGMRLASFRVAGATAAESGDVSVSRVGGDVTGNVQRWRKQMGLAPATPDEIAALAKRTLLGGPAVFVDLRGAFTDMGATTPLAGRRLLGLILAQGAESLFVKFVGPEALVSANESAFAAFATSLREDGGDEARENAPPPPEPPAKSEGIDPQRLRWDRPTGWNQAKPTRQFRLVDFPIEGAPSADAYLTLLSGTAGGVALNVNRWRAQMGAPELDGSAIAALERLDVLGGKAVFVEQPGDYVGMGGQRVTGAVFYGVILVLEHDAIFLVLVGPRAEVEPQREAFRALARSLRLEA